MEETALGVASQSVLFTKYLCVEVKNNEIGGECGTCGVKKVAYKV
jgi:hypothetical protein